MVCEPGQFIVACTPSRRLRRVCIVADVTDNVVEVHAWNKRKRGWSRRKRIARRLIVAALKPNRLPSWLHTHDVERAESLVVDARPVYAETLWG